MRLAIVGFVLAVAGIAVFGFTLSRLISGAALDPQAKVPGTVTVAIDTPGRHYVWDNHWTMFEGERFQYPADWPADSDISVVADDGTKLNFVADTSRNWSIGNNEKTSVGYVEVPEATVVRLQIGDVGRERIVTVSNRSMKQELWARLGGLGVGLAVGAIGVPVALLGLVLGRKKQRTAD